LAKSTVRGILKHYTYKGRMQDLPKSNRPRLMDVRDDCLAVRILNMKGVETAAAVARRLRENGLHVGDETVRRSLKWQGLTIQVKCKKPLLTKLHRVKKLSA
jgi:transposase